jgi:hypothetical protein
MPDTCFDWDAKPGRAASSTFPPNQPHGGRVIGLEPVVIIEAFHPPRKDYTPETQRADHDRPS